MLVPAAVLVLMILGAIAVDSAVAFMAQRELANAAAAAANDAAGAALSDQSFYGGGGEGSGTITVDQRSARQVVTRALRARSPRGLTVDGIEVAASAGQVCVSLRGRVDYLFAKAIPGAAHQAMVEGRATASAVEGPAGSPVARRALC